MARSKLLSVPRHRAGDFERQPIAKGQTRFGGSMTADDCGHPLFGPPAIAAIDHFSINFRLTKYA